MAGSSSSSSSISLSTKGIIECGGHHQPHVLAVDDNLIDRKLIEKLLRTSCCKVTTAENGMRALEYLGLGEHQNSSNLQDSKVDMIITDYCMPGMTGYELLKKVKESNTMKGVPVIVMSSENVPTRINKLRPASQLFGLFLLFCISFYLILTHLIQSCRCLEEGAQMFMLKPLKLSDVKKLTCQVMKC